MNLIIAENYEDMSRLAALQLLAVLAEGCEKRVNVSIIGGATPAGAYEYVSPLLRGLNLPGVHYYNFDEIPMNNGKKATLDSLRELFFRPCGIRDEQIEMFDEHNYRTYDRKLRADGGLDLVLMGLGGDGHFCGNIAGSFDDFGIGCHTVDSYLNEWLTGLLTDACGGRENIPDQFVTFGPVTVMEAKKLILIVSGEKKAEILKQVLEGPVMPEVPASILRLHSNFTVIADRAAASRLKEENIHG